MDSAIISFQNITKRFAKVTALADINLEIKKAEVFGLLGLNGAGKTTLLRCLLNLIRPDCGEIFFKGKHLRGRDIQKNFGFLPENFRPPGNLRGEEFLKILARGVGVNANKVEALFDEAGLTQQKKKYIKAYSRGMVQRLGLAIALLKEPEVIILDEPTLGLDPLGQEEMLSILLNLNRKGKTIFFSSHILSQVEKICHRIGIIHYGKILFTGKVSEFIQQKNKQTLEEAFLSILKENI